LDLDYSIKRNIFAGTNHQKPINTMLKLGLQSVFKARGIENPFTFLRKAGISYHSATAIINNQYNAIRFDHMTIICDKLNCTPNDLFTYVPTANENLSPEHPLNSLKKENKPADLAGILRTIPLNQLAEIADIINNRRNKKDAQ
jgi:DNA-binding Xre family transcriptional regulator